MGGDHSRHRNRTSLKRSPGREGSQRIAECRRPSFWVLMLRIHVREQHTVFCMAQVVSENGLGDYPQDFPRWPIRLGVFSCKMIMACGSIHAALESSIRYDATLASCKGHVYVVDPHPLTIEKAARKCAFLPPQVGEVGAREQLTCKRNGC